MYCHSCINSSTCPLRFKELTEFKCGAATGRHHSNESIHIMKLLPSQIFHDRHFDGLRNRTTFWVSWFQFCPVKIENKVTPVWGRTHQQPNCHEPVLPVGITGDILTRCVCVCDCVLPQPAVPPGTGNPLMGSKGLRRGWRRWRGSWVARAQVNPLIGSKGKRVARLWWPPGGSV